MHDFLKFWFEGVPADLLTIGYWNKITGTEWLSGFPTTEPDLKPDTYFHVCCHDHLKISRDAIQKGKSPIYCRGRNATATVVPGLAMDIDVGDKKNGKKYFKSLDKAVMAIEATQPSAIVESGTGLHVYYKFEIPLVVTDKNRDAVRAAMKAWGKDITLLLKVDVDSVFDLARVLRVPGTLHSGCGLEVNWASEKPTRYNAGEILGRYSGRDRDAGSFDGEKIEEAKVFSGELLSLMAVSSKFRGLWTSLPRDASAACFSIAKLLIIAGWSDEKIKGALILWRGKHGFDLKLKRSDDWYARTIVNARGATENSAMDDPTEMIKAICRGELWEPVPEKPVTEFFKVLFGEAATIAKVIPKLGIDCVSGEAQYRIGTPGRFFTIPPSTLMSYTKFKVMLLDQAKFVLPKPKQLGPWDAFVSAFVDECDDEISQSYATEEAMVAGSLSEYFVEAAQSSYDSVSKLQAISRPEVCDKGAEGVFFRITNMLGWVHNDLGVKLNIKALTGIASGLGYKRHDGGMWMKRE